MSRNLGSLKIILDKIISLCIKVNFFEEHLNA